MTESVQKEKYSSHLFEFVSNTTEKSLDNKFRYKISDYNGNETLLNCKKTAEAFRNTEIHKGKHDVIQDSRKCRGM